MMADTRFINVTNDLAAIRADLRDAQEARRRGDLRAAVTAQERALLPLARLVAEAHGFDKFGCELKREAGDDE